MRQSLSRWMIVPAVVLGLVIVWRVLDTGGWLAGDPDHVHDVFDLGGEPAVVRGYAAAEGGASVERVGRWRTSLAGHCGATCWVQPFGSGVLALTAYRPGRQGVLLDPDTGEKRWSLPPEIRTAHWLGIVDVGRSRAFLAWGHAIGESQVTALDLDDGSIVWRWVDSEDGPPPRVAHVGDAVVVARHSRVEQVDAASGAVLHEEAGTLACAHGDDVLLAREGLLLRIGGDGRAVPIGSVRARDGAQPVPTGRCGAYGDTLVVVLTRRRLVDNGSVQEALDVALLVAFDTDTWLPRWELDLGQSTFPHTGVELDPAVPWAALRPDALPLAANLSRYVGVELTGPGRSTGALHAVVDVELGEVAWRGQPSEGSAAFQWFRHGTRQVLSGRVGDDLLIGVLDGDTGRFAAPAVVRGASQRPSLHPGNAGAEGLWVAAGSRFAQLGWDDLAPTRGSEQAPDVSVDPAAFIEATGVPLDAL